MMDNEKARFESECPLCGGVERETGVTEDREGKRYREMECVDCGGKGFEWKKEWDSDEQTPQ